MRGLEQFDAWTGEGLGRRRGGRVPWVLRRRVAETRAGRVTDCRERGGPGAAVGRAGRLAAGMPRGGVRRERRLSDVEMAHGAAS